MKIFEFKHPTGEKDWVSAKNVIEAIHTYLIHSDCLLYDIIDSEVYELDKRFHHTHNTGDQTFSSFLRENKESSYITCTI
jgi:hypothetical protein